MIVYRATAIVVQETSSSQASWEVDERGNRKLSLETADFPSQISRSQKTPRPDHMNSLNCSSPVQWQGKRFIHCGKLAHCSIFHYFCVWFNPPHKVVKSGNQKGWRRTGVSLQPEWKWTTRTPGWPNIDYYWEPVIWPGQTQALGKQQLILWLPTRSPTPEHKLTILTCASWKMQFRE